VTLGKLLDLLAKYPPNLPVQFDMPVTDRWPSSVGGYKGRRGHLHLEPSATPITCAELTTLLTDWRRGGWKDGYHDPVEPTSSAPIWADSDRDSDYAYAIIGWERTTTTLVLQRASIADYV
jgi:hypothetical protein